MSRKRKKKAPLRNDFTDALNEEIAERKIVERTQPQEEVFQKTVTLEKKSVEVVKVEPAPPVAVAEKIEIEKIEVPPTIEVKPETKLEERILQEADNTFFDEKPAPKKSNSEKPQKKFVYRSKAMQRLESEKEKEKTPPKSEPAQPVNIPLKWSHAEKFGVVAAVAMLVYAFVTLDKPLFFLALSLFVHLLCTPAGNLFGKHSAAVQNSMRTFSIVLFFGALLFLFM